MHSATPFFKSNNASSEVIFAANLAIEEIATNIIKYASDDVLKHEIAVRLEMTENTLNIEFCDDGKEFNPFKRLEPDISLPPKARLGGLGVYFVHKMLDACAYDRRDGRNIVRLRKKL